MTHRRAGGDPWKQGEHILISGPTGSGKTTMMSKLVRLRKRVVVFVTKGHDSTIEGEFKGWTVLEEWPKDGPKSWQTKILLRPKHVPDNMGATIQRMREVFYHALNRINSQGYWTVVIDESLLFNDPKFIGLAKEIGFLHYHGRSNGITMVNLTQRPAWIPTVIYSSVTHAWIARTRDANDLKRLGELGGIDTKSVQHNVTQLPTRQDYLYVNPQGDALPAIVNTRK